MSSYIKQPFLKIRSKTVITLSQAEIIELKTKDPLCVSLSLSECIHSAPPRIKHTDINSECLWWQGREKKKSIFEDFSSKAVEKISGKRLQQQPRTSQIWVKIGPKTSSTHQKTELLKSDSVKSATPTLQALRLAAFQREETAFPAFKGPAS